jgi:hypothetical protein
LPPVRMTAYITKTSSVALGSADRFLQINCAAWGVYRSERGRPSQSVVKPDRRPNPVVPATLEILK